MKKVVFLSLLAMVFLGCNKNNGLLPSEAKFGFSTLASGEEFQIYLDGEYIGHLANDNNGSSNMCGATYFISQRMENGSHSVSIKDMSGNTSGTGSFSVSDDECFSFDLTNIIGNSTGGGAGGTGGIGGTGGTNTGSVTFWTSNSIPGCGGYNFVVSLAISSTPYNDVEIINGHYLANNPVCGYADGGKAAVFEDLDPGYYDYSTYCGNQNYNLGGTVYETGTVYITAGNCILKHVN